MRVCIRRLYAMRVQYLFRDLGSLVQNGFESGYAREAGLLGIICSCQCVCV